MEITLAGCRIPLRPAAHEFSQAFCKFQCNKAAPSVANIANRDFEPDSRFQNRIDALIFGSLVSLFVLPPFAPIMFTRFGVYEKNRDEAVSYHKAGGGTSQK